MDEVVEVNHTGTDFVTLPHAWYQFNGFVLCFVAIVSWLGNISVIVIFFKHKRLRTPSNVFILSLALGDFLMSFLMPLYAAANFSEKWIYGDVWCTMSAFIVYFIGMADIYCITATAFQRHQLISKLRSSSFNKIKMAVLTSILSWCAGLLWAVVPFTGLSSYGLEGVRVSCGLDWSRNDVSSQLYIILLFVFGFAFPSAFIIFCYSSIYRKVAKSGKSLGKGKARGYVKKNLRIVKTALLLTCGFYLAWTPYAIVSFWRAFGDPEDLPGWVVSSPALFAKCSCVWNPIIYAGTNKQFRQGFIDIIPCIKLRRVFIPVPSLEQSTVHHSNEIALEAGVKGHMSQSPLNSSTVSNVHEDDNHDENTKMIEDEHSSEKRAVSNNPLSTVDGHDSS